MFSQITQKTVPKPHNVFIKVVTDVEDLYKVNHESGFPLDIKLRLCPQIQDASDPTTIAKFERLRIHQAAFLENVQKTQTSDIAVLDFVDEKLMDADAEAVDNEYSGCGWSSGVYISGQALSG